MVEMVTYITGSVHHAGALDAIPCLLLEEELRLVREKDNKHDRHAVAVHYDTLKLGYVPRQEAPAVAKAIDSGLTVRAFYRGWRNVSIVWEA